MKAKHPMQPLVRDPKGVVRFKKNPIVDHLLEHGGLNLNNLMLAGHALGFTKDDWTQFAQLIGYSVSGFGELSYVDKKAQREADRLASQLSRRKR